MNTLYKNASVYYNGSIEKMDLLITSDGYIKINPKAEEDTNIIDATNLLITPGLIDSHVHLRTPGFEYKEDMKSGTMSMAKGGYSTVFSMPNLNPVCDSEEALELQRDAIAKDAVIKVLPVCAVTLGERGKELSDIERLSSLSIGFSDDGKGIQDEEMMREAARRVKECGSIIMAHCEDESLIEKGGCINEGPKAVEFNLTPISPASEYEMVKRDVKIAVEEGLRYHVCHISSKESVEAVREAKRAGGRVTAEAAVHHMILCEDDIVEDDGRFKMNPPLKSSIDRKSLIEGINDDTIEVICTDHAPHSREEKSRGFKGSAMGIIGSEFAFSLVYTNLVKTGELELKKVIDCMYENPVRIFGLERHDIKEGALAEIAIFDLYEEEEIKEENIISKGKSTPFMGNTVSGICILNMINGKTVYRRKQ